VPEYIGRYRAERVVGSGAFATVWLALDETLGAWVAIKVLAENWARDDEIRGRFMEEARILWRADSEHIVRIHNVDAMPDGRPYFVMDYADRGTLGERMRQRAHAGRPWSVDEAVGVSRAIANGLKVAHSIGIVHRDLKPANVMFQSLPAHHGSGQVEKLILTDFGIAKSLARSRGTTISAGTPHYMPPEQIEGIVDERSDVYAAAVILYELLAGRLPYPYDSFHQLLAAASRGEEAVPIGQLRPDVPESLARAIHSGFAFDRQRRWPNAAAWSTAIAVGRGSRTAAAAAVGPTPTAAAAPTYQPTADAPVPPPPPGPSPPAQPPARPPPPAPPTGPQPAGSGGGGPRRWPAVALAIVVLLAIAGGAAGVLIATRGGDEAQAATGIVLEPIASVGQDPFTPSVVPPPDSAAGTEIPPDTDLPQEILDRLGGSIEGADPAVIAALIEELLRGLNPELGGATDFTLPDLDIPFVPGQITSVSGSAVGLYGGTQLLNVCDRELLIRFLTENADKARAWAEAQGIDPGDIAAFVRSLTDVILQVDTRVTNHGFTNGQANPIDAVLQAGTAVLVDGFGVPRVRCYCGNPLRPPRAVGGAPQFQGTPWPGFVFEQTVIIEATIAVPEYVIDDVLAGTFVYRLPGAEPSTATLVPSVTETPAPPPSTEPPASTLEPPAATLEPPAATAEPPATTERPPATDITAQGAVNASSEFPTGEFPASLSVDGSDATSWFSAGSDVEATSVFAWGTPDQSNVYIDTIEILGNANHPDFPTGFGFGELTIQVTSEDGVVWEKTVPLPGTPDPNVTVRPRAVGDTILLAFSGHEASNCGGFAELIVMGGPP
jgi:serine/threonine protein kinase